MIRRFRPVAVAALAALRHPLDVADPFADVLAATRRHRRRHRCGAFAYGDGTLPATLAAAVDARRVVEVGTALGYTALSMAHAAPGARVETIERDDTHVGLAREQIADHGLADRVEVLHGTAETVLATLPPGAYDLAFFDGFTPTADVVRQLHVLLRPGGTLVVGNLILGPERAVTDDLADPDRWRTHAMGETALCVKAAEGPPGPVDGAARLGSCRPPAAPPDRPTSWNDSSRCSLRKGSRS
ncbi:O-methyltransferase [Streptomyces sp. NPDC058417]|uniref:O-methyltransferase n=1 Tax=unclassified Streptomyces TaxID=2593676 RepID=UPI003656673A